MCEQAYFLGYVLGLYQKPNKKAELGTIVHKVMECLAYAKKALQDGETSFKDSAIGEIHIKHDMVYSDNFVEFLHDKSYRYYTSKSPNEFTEEDRLKTLEWTYKPLTTLNGSFDPRNRDIVCPELQFDFEIPEDWALYEYAMPDGTILKGRLALKGTIDLVTKIDDGVYESVDWKGLPIDTMIPTIDGWKTIGELNIGDTIFDKDGQQTTVLAKSKKNFKQCYEITFDDNKKVVCDYEHLWLLDNGDVVSTPYLNIGNKIDINKPLNIDEKTLPIDPYILGLWLGDGRKRSPEITSCDDFIFNEIIKRGYKLGHNLDTRKQNLQTRTILNVRDKFVKLNLLNNKHIPELYLRSSYKQRLELLRGLMDTDGNVNICRKQAVFTTTNKTLSDNVKELLISLGQRVNQSYIKRDTNFKKNVEIFPLHFRPININPFLLPRKAEKIDNTWGSGQSNKRVITEIKVLLTNLETQCIMVDSPSNTYLCTENMIPTHNTGQRLDWNSNKDWPHNIKTYEKLIADPQLRIYHYALHNTFPDAKQFIPTIYFINDHGTKDKPVKGGIFSMPYTKRDIDETKEMIRKRFEKIKTNNRPQLVKTWKCKAFCHFGRTAHGSGEIDPRTGRPYTICEYIAKKIRKNGINQVMIEESNKDHHVGIYHSPGA
jgi:intein/homing endonuclease